MKFDIRDYLDYERINLIKNFFVNIGKRFTGLFKSENEKCAFDIISFAMVILGIVYVVIATLHGHNNQLSFKIVTAGFVVAFLIINDVVEPAYKGELKTLDRDKKNNYLKYVIFDVAGFMALLYFALYAGEIRHVFHYLGLAIFVLLIKPKKESYDEFTKENA